MRRLLHIAAFLLALPILFLVDLVCAVAESVSPDFVD